MKYLFIDDHDIDAIDNLARKLHQPEKFVGNAVVRPEYRWENEAVQIWGMPTWDPDESIFKMIYHGSAEQGNGASTADSGIGGSFMCYATSTDGVNWDKPFLGLYDYPGLLWNGKPIGIDNNILPSIDGHLRGHVYHAADPDPERRYKAFALRGGHLYSFASPDAINWRELDVPPQSSADVSELYLDDTRDLFIATVKHKGPYGRSFFLSTSGDFSNWSEQELIFHADQTDQEIGAERTQRFFDDPDYLTPIFNRPEEWRTDVYHFPVFRYEGLYLAQPVMHHWTGKHPPMFENVDSRKTVELASSRDLRQWNRVASRAPFMELSPVGDGSGYDTGQIGTTNGAIRRNNELWFYYMGLRYRSLTFAEEKNRASLDSSAICMARLRLDGFVSLKGGVEWGSVLSKPVEVAGTELRVNVDSWRGKVKAEVIDAEDGRVIPGYGSDESIPAVIDSVDAPMRWKDRSNLSELGGKTVRIRFSIWQGELYGFWFAG